MADADSIRITSRCTMCREVKDASQFNKAAHHKNGLSSRCKPCNAEYYAAYKASGGVRKSHASRAAEKLAATHKTCPKCGETKAKSEFSQDRKRNDGLKPWCKACHNASTRSWRVKNPERQRLLCSSWAASNKDKVRAKSARWSERHPGRQSELAKKWVNENRARVREAERARRATPRGSLMHRISTRLRSSIRGGKGGESALSLVGYSLQDLMDHLERQFLHGMSWSNMREWHIDHIVPLSSFNVSGPTDPELRRAWALTNLRPLWSKDNLRKHAKRTHLI